jgi:hypothetical protein
MAAPPVRSEVLAHNGAGYCWVPTLRKFAVVGADGTLHGYRYDVAAARELAASLPGVPVDEPQPAPVSRSPHAMPLPQVEYLPPGVPRDERRDFFEERAPTVISAFEQSHALCRRQAVAHERIFGRHLRRR